MEILLEMAFPKIIVSAFLCGSGGIGLGYWFGRYQSKEERNLSKSASLLPADANSEKDDIKAESTESSPVTQTHVKIESSETSKSSTPLLVKAIIFMRHGARTPLHECFNVERVSKLKLS